MVIELFDRKFEFFASERQVRKFFLYLDQFVLKKSVLIILVFLIIYMIWMNSIKQKGHIRKYDCFMLGYPIIYYLLILSVFVFERDSQISVLNVKLDQWKNGADGVHETVILTFILDAIIFFIYGILLQVSRNKLISNMIIVFVSALFIEELQYILSCGVASSTDLLSDCIGGFLGATFKFLYNSYVNKRINQ